MKGVLTAEQSKLEKTLVRIAHKTGKGAGKYDADFPEYGDDEDENAMEVAEYSSSLSLESELEKSLRDANNALKRIEEGTYGVDKYTGDLIAEGRLRARPTSTSSVASKKTLTQEM